MLWMAALDTPTRALGRMTSGGELTCRLRSRRGLLRNAKQRPFGGVQLFLSLPRTTIPGRGDGLQLELGRRVSSLACGRAPKRLLCKEPANSDFRLNSSLAIFLKDECELPYWWPVSFMPGRVLETSNTENSDLGHGTCQALPATSCTKQISSAQLSCVKLAGVKGIGPRTSEVSDITTLQVPNYAKWMR